MTPAEATYTVFEVGGMSDVERREEFGSHGLRPVKAIRRVDGFWF